MPVYEDSNFALVGHVDDSKRYFFDASNGTTGTDNTLKLPASVGGGNQTIAILEGPNIFTDLQTIAAGTGGLAVRGNDGVTLFDVTDAHGTVLYAQGTGSRSIALPDATGTVALLEAAQTWTGVQSFNSGINSGPATISDGGSGDDVALRLLNIDSGNRLILHDNNPAGDRDQYFQDANGTIALVETSSTVAAKINSTAQTANITSTDTGVATGKFYRVSYTLAATTADVTAGAVSASFAYTDESGSTTTTSATVPLTTLGNRATGSFVTFLNSGTLNYLTSHTGIFGTAQYSLRVRVESLG